MVWEPHRPEIIEELTNYPIEEVNTKEAQNKLQKEWDAYISKATESYKLLNNFVTKITWNLHMIPLDSYKAAEHYLIKETPQKEIAVPYIKHLETGETKTYALLKITYIA